MLWQGRRESDNVDDERGLTGGHFAVGGGVIGVIFLIVKLLLGGGGDVQLPQQSPLPGQQTQASGGQNPADDERVHFVKVIFADTEDIWTEIMKKMGRDYPKPRLGIFTDAVQTGCGNASAQTGPFYCPADRKVYIDLSFFQELQDRFKAPGEFAQAYVIAHEVGHHIQNLLGVSDKMERLRQQLSEQEYNKYSVRLELQADFYAGVWAHYEQGKGYLEAGDLEKALNAAQAIGDDRLQKQAQGYVVPESFTHGTSAERMYWLKKGFDTGDINQGDTFNTTDLH